MIFVLLVAFALPSDALAGEAVVRLNVRAMPAP